MQYVDLPNSPLRVSRIAMGCWAIAGDATWGPQDAQEAERAVCAALDAGINFFDTAELYGDGRSEELLGAALHGRRSQAVIASKFNVEHSGRDDLLVALHGSLRRLRTDVIDLYQIHWPSRTVARDETISALEHARRQGLIRAIGVCNFGPRDLEELLPLARPATNQLPYNLLWRAIEFEIAPRCRRENIGILCYSPLQISLLTGKFRTPDDVPPGRARTRHFSASRPLTRHGEPGCEEAVFAAIDQLRRLAEELGAALPQLALAWLLHQPGVSAVLCGMRNAGQAQAAAAAAELTLDAATLERLDRITAGVKTLLGPNPDMWESAARSRFR